MDDSVQEEKERDKRLMQKVRSEVTMVCTPVGSTLCIWDVFEGTARRTWSFDFAIIILWDEEMAMVWQSCGIFGGGYNRN